MTDLALSTVTHDLAFQQTDSGADLAFVISGPLIVQRVKITLLSLLSEWFLLPTWGMPWFESVLVKAPNISLIESVLRSRIMAVEGVSRITSITLDYDAQDRRLGVAFEMQTDVGLLPVSVNLSPVRPL